MRAYEQIYNSPKYTDEYVNELRIRFASAALTGILSYFVGSNTEAQARRAYSLADEMLKIGGYVS